HGRDQSLPRNRPLVRRAIPGCLAAEVRRPRVRADRDVPAESPEGLRSIGITGRSTAPRVEQNPSTSGALDPFGSNGGAIRRTMSSLAPDRRSFVASGFWPPRGLDDTGFDLWLPDRSALSSRHAHQRASRETPWPRPNAELATRAVHADPLAR